MKEDAKKEIKKLKQKLKVQEKKNIEVRDRMAMERTIFANERTLMAFLRTALASIGGGFVAMKFSQEAYLDIVGGLLILAGMALAVYAFYRYRQKQRLITTNKEQHINTSHEHAAIIEKEASAYGNID